MSEHRRSRPFPWEEHKYPEREFDEALDYAIEQRRKARSVEDRRRANEVVRRAVEGRPEDVEEILEDARRPRAEGDEE